MARLLFAGLGLLATAAVTLAQTTPAPAVTPGQPGVGGAVTGGVGVTPGTPGVGVGGTVTGPGIYPPGYNPGFYQGGVYTGGGVYPGQVYGGQYGQMYGGQYPGGVYGGGYYHGGMSGYGGYSIGYGDGCGCSSAMYQPVVYAVPAGDGRCGKKKRRGLFR